VKRDEVLSLLKDLMVACESMHLSPVVSLTPCPRVGRWKLSIKWNDGNEKGCFDKIINERGLLATQTDDGYTIFRKP
jgi:hypothetical protein